MITAYLYDSDYQHLKDCELLREGNVVDLSHFEIESNNLAASVNFSYDNKLRIKLLKNTEIKLCENDINIP